ncbi:hypothetical protein CAPTEDRAFT_187163, partial [Capitella teleta]
HLDHFENLIEELETISRASACPWAQVHCFLTSQKIQDMCRELNINSAAVLQVALQFCEDIVTRPANFALPSKDTNTETVTDHQSEIIMYITGAILHKLKKRYARSGRSDDLDVIEGLISHEKKKGPRPSLIEVKSRGGLLTPVEALEPLMRIAYQKFKTGLKSAGLFSAEVMTTGLPEESPISDLDDSVVSAEALLASTTWLNAAHCPHIWPPSVARRLQDDACIRSPSGTILETSAGVKWDLIWSAAIPQHLAELISCLRIVFRPVSFKPTSYVVLLMPS